MPSIDRNKRPDLTDIADDDVRSIQDIPTRDAVFRVTEKLKRIFEYQMEALEVLYDAVTAIEIAVDALDD